MLGGSGKAPAELVSDRSGPQAVQSLPMERPEPTSLALPGLARSEERQQQRSQAGRTRRKWGQGEVRKGGHIGTLGFIY